jgi:hypothetical protein
MTCLKPHSRHPAPKGWGGVRGGRAQHTSFGGEEGKAGQDWAGTIGEIQIPPLDLFSTLQEVGTFRDGGGVGSSQQSLQLGAHPGVWLHWEAAGLDLCAERRGREKSSRLRSLFLGWMEHGKAPGELLAGELPWSPQEESIPAPKRGKAEGSGGRGGPSASLRAGGEAAGTRPGFSASRAWASLPPRGATEKLRCGARARGGPRFL